MTTIEITDIADVQDGDIVTLRWEKSEGATVTLEGPMRSWAVRSAITDERFVSATREVPEWEPGTVYEITTLNGDTERAWYLKRVLGGSAFVTREGDEFTVEELASIQPVPDDAETLRRDVVKYKEAARKYQREHDKECAEVERLRALEVEEVWVSGPDAAPLPEAILTPDGAFYEDGVTPLEITDEMMRASGWKKQRRRVTPWEDA